MAEVLNVTPDELRGVVRVQGQGVPDGPALITRKSERTPEPIRGGDLVVSTGGFILEDPEPPFGVDLTYRITATPTDRHIQTNRVLNPKAKNDTTNWLTGVNRTLNREIAPAMIPPRDAVTSLKVDPNASGVNGATLTDRTLASALPSGFGPGRWYLSGQLNYDSPDLWLWQDVKDNGTWQDAKDEGTWQQVKSKSSEGANQAFATFWAAVLGPTNTTTERSRNLITNPRGQTPNTTVTERRRNLNLNPAAVSGGWAYSLAQGGGGAGTFSYQTGSGLPAPLPTTYARGTVTTTGTWARIQVGDGPGLTPGTTITASVYGRHSAVRTVQCQVIWLNSTNGYVGETAGANIVSVAGRWVRPTATVVVPAGATQARICFNATTSAAGDTIDATGALLEVAPTVGDWFDGSTADTETQDYAWTGTANASASIASSAWIDVRRNLNRFPKPVGPSSNVAAAGQVTSMGAGTTLSTDTARVETGTYSVKATPNGGNNLGVAWWLTTGGEGPAAVLNGKFTLRARAYSDTAITLTPYGEGEHPTTSAYQGFTGGTQAVPNTIAVPAGQWTDLVYTLDVSVSGVGSRYLHMGFLGPNSPVWFDRVIIEAGTTVGDYFGGDTADVDPYRYEWVGAVNASASVQRSRKPSGWSDDGPFPTGTQAFVDGAYAVRFTPTNSNYIDVPTPAASGTGTLLLEAKRADPAVASNLNIYINAGLSGLAPALTAAWQTVRIPFTITAATTRVYLSSYAATGPAFLRNVAVVLGNYTGPYFDGDTPDSGTPGQAGYVNRAWVGTPHASASTETVTDPVVVVAPFQVLGVQAIGGNQWHTFQGWVDVPIDAPAGSRLVFLQGTTAREYAVSWWLTTVMVTPESEMDAGAVTPYFDGDSTPPADSGSNLVPGFDWFQVTDDADMSWNGTDNASVSIFTGPSVIAAEGTTRIDTPGTALLPRHKLPLMLSDPILPQVSVWFELVEISDLGYAARQQLLDVISRGPQIAVSSARAWASGEFRLMTYTPQQALVAERMFAPGRILFLRNPDPDFPENAWHLAIGNVSQGRVSPVAAKKPERLWSVPFVRVERPVGLIAAASGITWSDIKTGYTWDELRQQRADWLDAAVTPA